MLAVAPAVGVDVRDRGAG